MESEMTNRFWGVAVLASMVLAQSPSIRADDALLPNGGTAQYQSPVGQAYAPRQVAVASLLPRQTNQGWLGGGAPTSFTQPVQGRWPPVAGNQPAPVAGPAQVVAPTNGVVRLPPTGFANVSGAASTPTLPGSPQVVDGTIRDDGEYVTITLDGKETKLLKPRATPMLNIPGAPSVAEGAVRGRLMQSGRPLANCRVVIVPLQADGKNYRYDVNREPLSMATNNEGVYSFEHVPVGQYKLTWLPDGTNQWIRRVAIKPDVVVHAGQTVSVNTIGAARQTIN